MPLWSQIVWLFLLAIPVACVSWTWTQEEITREIRELLLAKCESSMSILMRKVCYALTCEYCFSHYVTALVLYLTGFKLLREDFTGYLLSGFSIVWIANIYMTYMAIHRTRLKLMRQTASRNEEESGSTVSKGNGTSGSARGAISAAPKEPSLADPREHNVA